MSRHTGTTTATAAVLSSAEDANAERGWINSFGSEGPARTDRIHLKPY